MFERLAVVFVCVCVGGEMNGVFKTIYVLPIIKNFIILIYINFLILIQRYFGCLILITIPLYNNYVKYS